MNMFSQVVNMAADESLEDRDVAGLSYWLFFVMAFVFTGLTGAALLGTMWSFVQILENPFFLVPAVVGVILVFAGALIVGLYAEIGFRIREARDA